jgi:SnoaL-like domain
MPVSQQRRHQTFDDAVNPGRHPLLTETVNPVRYPSRTKSSRRFALKDITHQLPQVIVDHIAAHNSPDPQAFLATFAPDALLNDAQRELLGHEAIRAWAAKEIFGDNVTLEVQWAWEHAGGVILHARYDGDFDKTNLPDPLILTNYFVLREGKIAQLVTLLNKTIWAPAQA